MTITRRPVKHCEDGLSEVIGFIIIFGIIAIVFSNYMLYGIPAQGRDSEIAHMNEVKDQFVDYKVGLDSLFNNNKVGTTISNSFTLGTGGSYSTGAISIIPMINPAKSSGTIAINERVTEYLNISSQSLIVSESAPVVVQLSSTSQQINYTPRHIYVSISGIQLADLSSSGIFGTTIRGTNWIATVNITHPQIAYTKWIVTTFSGGSAKDYCEAYCLPNLSTVCTVIEGTGMCACLQPTDAYKRATISELQLSVSKNNVFTMKNYPIYDNITPGTAYTIDLMDEAYGLNSFIQPPDTVSLVKDNPLGSINATGNVTYAFTEMSSPNYNLTLPLGAIEYHAQNNYWISPDYYYQLGGIFVTQDDGNSTYKLPTEITFSNNTATNIVTVNINALVIDQNSRGIVGGNSPIQIKTTLKSNAALPYVAGTANAKWIRIGIKTTDPKALAMWKNYFEYSAMAAGIPNTVTGSTTTESYIIIDGASTNRTPGIPYDINVIASNATFSPILHGIGGTYT